MVCFISDFVQIPKRGKLITFDPNLLSQLIYRIFSKPRIHLSVPFRVNGASPSNVITTFIQYEKKEA